MIYIQDPLVYPDPKSVITGHAMPIFGQTLGMNFKDLIYCNVAKQLQDKNSIVVPSWTNMFHYNDTIGLDIAKELFYFPKPALSSTTISNICWPSLGASEIETNHLFKEWCINTFNNDDINLICSRIIGFSHIITVNSKLRSIFKDAISFLKIKPHIREAANEYINNTLTTNKYISLGIRTSGYTRVFSKIANLSEQEFYTKLLYNYRNILHKKIKEYETNIVYVASESLNTIVDFIALCKKDQRFKFINFYFNDQNKRSDSYKYKKYTEKETISYYQSLVKEAFIMGLGLSHTTSISHFQFFASMITNSNWTVINEPSLENISNENIMKHWNQFIDNNVLNNKQAF